MGKKRKFNRFIKWIKSDLPEDKTPVLLLGVTKLSSPKLQRRNNNSINTRPHTLHLEFPATSEHLADNFDYSCELAPLNYSPLPTLEILNENSQNIDKNVNRKSATILPSVKSSSFSSSKENTSPISSVKSSSFSVSHNSTSTAIANTSRKRVSFTDDTYDLIRSRDIARKNRDLVNSPVKNHYVELPIGYCNNHAGEPQRRKSSVDLEEIGDILDEISDDLNIRPISRRNSAKPDQTSTELLENLYRQFERIEKDLDDEDDGSTDIILDHNKNKYFYSENDIYSRLEPKITNRQRKLSVPIAPVHTDDVGTFINEIISELDIGPKIIRTRSDSRSRQSKPVIHSGDSFPEEEEEVEEKPNSASDSGGPPSSSTTDRSKRTSSIPTSSSNEHTSLPSVPNNQCVQPDFTSEISVPVEGANTSSVKEEDTNSLSEAIMDRSMDSIGSCSLDVDLSTDFSEKDSTVDHDTDEVDRDETTSISLWNTLSSFPTILNLSWISNLMSSAGAPSNL